MKISPSAVISKSAKLGSNIVVSDGVIIYDNVVIGDNSFIGPYCVVGEPVAAYYKNPDAYVPKITRIGNNAIIRSFTTIYEDVVIGDNFQSGHHAIIREETKIGCNTSFGSFSECPGHSVIGNFVRIHSKVMLSEYNVIEDYVWIFPFVVITNVKHPPVGGFETTVIREYAQLFSHAIILPGVTIGKNAIIAAGAVVTRNVGDERVIVGNPGKDVKSVREIKDDKGDFVYPWRDHITVYRGYPWQTAE
jgi:acetyltransferase-like isoleucine patch superfamily enzyme